MLKFNTPGRKVLKVWLCLALFIGLGSVVLSYGCHTEPSGSADHPDQAVGKTLPDSCPCGDLTVVFGPQVPGDASIFANQENADCFAWSEFISLNWPSTSGRGFGDPGDLLPVQWETYMPKEVLYPKDGQAPPAWGSTAIPETYTGQIRALGLPATTKVLHFISKFEDEDLKPFIQRTRAARSRMALNANRKNDSVSQAFPFDEPSWLGAQNGTNVWYEVLLNKDIYDYVVKTHFYDARVQLDSAKKGSPVFFPFGVFNGAVGAIELKAAWMEVTDSTNPKWNRFKLSRAEVIDPSTGQLRTVRVALVGLHILHKTQLQQSWVWSTFEQVDNVPNDPGGSKDNNFHSDNCKPNTFSVPPGCLASNAKNPVTVSCSPNTPPPYYLCDKGPGPVPIQATRLLPLSLTSKNVNQRMQDTIQARYPNSVFRYYELVNVLWSTTPQQPQTDTMPTPFPMIIAYLRPSPSSSPVANTTMETYIQDSTCTGCHVYSSIAKVPGTNASRYFGDFSFAIGSASASKAFKDMQKRSQNKKSGQP
jgi:hypothetical protein